MSEEHAIVAQVEAAQRDSNAADELIRQYMGFIRAETARFIHRVPVEGRDDELSIAMLAFYEAVLGYNRGRGSFLGYAARSIKNRLIDHVRREKRHAGLTSLQETEGDDQDELGERLSDGKDEIADMQEREATRQEIAEFGKQLAQLGLSFSDVADNCPCQERTVEACRKVLAHARRDKALLDELVRTGRLPVAELAARSGVERKTMERHRKYLVALLLAFTNGYEIIRGHLCRISPMKGGDLS